MNYKISGLNRMVIYPTAYNTANHATAVHGSGDVVRVRVRGSTA